ncbi:hypothetical protein O3M35_002129 [Rhynocoris fuscipes]|uniref:Uncharacterized protein n=1 Tax=Rhynocoris fuscipes TaxID=488301 RepID=A0AAW1CR52_9HEMI
MNKEKKSSVKQKRLTNNIQALRNIQLELAKLQGDFLYEVLVLEDEYETKLAPYYERRLEIITGNHEPTDVEASCPLTYVHIPDTGNVGNASIRGIPGFWLIVFNNIPLIWSMIQRYDRNPLTHLIDIKCVRNVRNQELPGFTLEFYFEPNQFFTNGLLTKEYIVRYGSKKCDPFNCFGPEMVDCNGCEIHWKAQDLTVTIANNKLIKRPSFFNFFDPPKSEDPNIKPYILNYLMTDFQIGYYLKEKVIPNATLYYLGEAVLREHFGFDPTGLEEENTGEVEDWPMENDKKTLIKEKQSKLNLKPEERKKWEQSEKLLGERLKKNIEKSDYFEKSKVTVDAVATKLENLTDKVKYQNLEMIKRKVKGHDVHTIIAKDPIKARAGIATYASNKKDGKQYGEPMVVKSFPQSEQRAQMLREHLISTLKKEKPKMPTKQTTKSTQKTTTQKKPKTDQPTTAPKVKNKFKL